MSNSANIEGVRFESFTRLMCDDADTGLVVIAVLPVRALPAGDDAPTTAVSDDQNGGPS